NNVSVYPTVFSGETTVEYTLTESAPVTLKLTSLLGAEVATVSSPTAFLSRGNYSVKLNLAGSGLGAGIYLLKFTAGDYSKTIKLVYSPQ
ncbi:MAG TPA: T9SS type A sorting domain-containing protein, partial [Bacteroidia bacterium]|nr:T9SS type A sorting domain-containing protein [Bacteroidia bacterium]